MSEDGKNGKNLCQPKAKTGKTLKKEEKAGKVKAQVCTIRHKFARPGGGGFLFQKKRDDPTWMVTPRGFRLVVSKKFILFHLRSQNLWSMGKKFSSRKPLEYFNTQS